MTNEQLEKAIEQGKDIYTFDCPEFYAPYIWNSDETGINEEEIKAFSDTIRVHLSECMLTSKKVNLTPIFHWLENEEGNMETYFTHKPDFISLGATCFKLLVEFR